MRMCYFDCFSGISGNMVLGALIDIGLPKSVLHEEVAKLGLEAFDIEVGRNERMKIHGAHVKVKARGNDSPQRSYRQIKGMIEGSPLGMSVKEKSLDIFHRLASAEARIHRPNLDSISFGATISAPTFCRSSYLHNTGPSTRVPHPTAKKTWLSANSGYSRNSETGSAIA